MSTLTITLSEDRFVQLKEAATRFGVAPEELARASIEELLSRPDGAFQRVLEHVLRKNAELYQRLAAL
ncbi:MAG: DNA-binding protein [Chloroflexi bacterium]|nr:DNA-binding protein [Chloroflexota bacterium]MBU1748822.1 DNA-binding protein [Chloroflexota bacterium]MBU1877828.1 DNA-binding protein [Chloroflexota bacterium]